MPDSIEGDNWRMGDTLEITRIVFSKTSFDEIPENERIFMVQILMFANEISMLQKIIKFSNYPHEGHPVLTSAQNTQTFFLVKLFAGKLFEGYELVRKNYFGNQLSKQYHSLLPDWSNRALDSLKRYFGRDNLIGLIRNNFAFHYNEDLVREQLGAIPDDEDLDLYLTSDHGNSLYFMAHKVSSYALFKKVNPSDDFQALDKIFEETLSVASNFLNFADGIVPKILEKNRIQVKSDPPINLKGIQNIDSVKLPYFVSR